MFRLEGGGGRPCGDGVHWMSAGTPRRAARARVALALLFPKLVRFLDCALVALAPLLLQHVTLAV